MRSEPFYKNSYYLVKNFGIYQNKIFIDQEDKVRLIFLLTHLQSPIRLYNISWYTNRFIKKRAFGIQDKRVIEIIKNRTIELLAFRIENNGFYILVKNLEEQILSVYMQRILTAYSKYYNAKYKNRGHVFVGPFIAEPINNTKTLVEASAILHKNGDEWSTFGDYVESNRWPNLINTDTILSKFKTQHEYKNFIENSPKNNTFKETSDNLA